MRWRFRIPSILLLLTLCVELCAMYDTALVKDPSSLMCILDDDDIDVKEGGLEEHSFSAYGPFSFAEPDLTVRWVNAECVLRCEGAVAVTPLAGVRRHRWLCRECC